MKKFLDETVVNELMAKKKKKKTLGCECGVSRGGGK